MANVLTKIHDDYINKCESNGLSAQEKKFNIDFQDGGHLGFPIRTILATFELQITSILPMKFESIDLLVQEKTFKIDFQHGCYGNHLGFLIRMILAIFDQQVPLILPIKFRVNGPFYLGEEVKNRFSRLQLWGPSCISDRSDFSYFWSTSHFDDSYKVSSQLDFGFMTRSKNRFQDSHHGGYLGFPIETILAI